MFLTFFYMLRAYGLPVSPSEWMTLMQALDEGLIDNSLLRFYQISRSILCRNEKDYDSFDLAFLACFGDIETTEDMLSGVRDWLENDTLERDLSVLPDDPLVYDELEKLMEELEKRLREQTEKHDGGNYWIGTGGTSPFGHGGYNPQGIRIGGYSRANRAVKVAAQRNFRDFREDEVIGIRQYQTAFRRLRQYSSRVDAAPTELNVQGTIDETCDNAGFLKLVFEKPRMNTVKVLLLMDSGGSMDKHATICNQLFQALSKANHFKDLQIFYFHNCIYDDLYLTPQCDLSRSVKTKRVIASLNRDYRVVLLGDAEMAVFELTEVNGIIDYRMRNDVPGIEWLRTVDKAFDHKIWLNPRPRWDWESGGMVTSTDIVRQVFPMYEMTVQGVTDGIKELLGG